MTRDAMQRLLEEAGWQVSLAATLGEALAALEERLRWVVLDLRLPDGDGIEVLARIRGRGIGVGVIVVTAVTDPAHLERARALEPDAVLRKPADFNRLLALINENA